MPSPIDSATAPPTGARETGDRLSAVLSGGESPWLPQSPTSRGGVRDLKPVVQRTDTNGLSQAERVRDKIYDQFVAAAAARNVRLWRCLGSALSGGSHTGTRYFNGAIVIGTPQGRTTYTDPYGPRTTRSYDHGTWTTGW